MKKLKQISRLLMRGLLLEPSAYDEAADGENPFVEGLFLVTVVGLAVALTGLIGGVLGWAITPDLAQYRQIILEGLQNMPWFKEMSQNPDALQIFQQQYDMGWQISEFFAPNAGNMLSALILGPLSLIIGWLLFAIVAQGIARLLGGNGTMKEMLGATALAVAPHLLNVFHILPMVTVAAVGTWSLLARYVAVRRVHENLTWGRALLAVLLPPILLALILGVLFVIFFSALVALIGGFVS